MSRVFASNFTTTFYIIFRVCVCVFACVYVFTQYPRIFNETKSFARRRVGVFVSERSPRRNVTLMKGFLPSSHLFSSLFSRLFRYPPLIIFPPSCSSLHLDSTRAQKGTHRAFSRYFARGLIIQETESK